ncbi:hypothetical protein [Pseudofrankia sp. EUN1h]|uniref:hypothetical protein n=1 Tax=Pseudofrankia sp. EUN1h TaxID=1834515 RepID=UPI0012FEDFE2|nr:hypothetical protein [Pseudofrankia sp. EUN1h]
MTRVEYASVSAWLPAILADFAGSPVAGWDVRLIDFDPARPGDVVALIPDIDTWVIPTKPSAHLLLLKVADLIGKSFVNVKGLDDLADTPEGVAMEIASTLQDHVMDNLNTTWPEVAVDGRTVVLEPRLGPDGTPRWEGRGVEPCPFGQLAYRLT